MKYTRFKEGQIVYAIIDSYVTPLQILLIRKRKKGKHMGSNDEKKTNVSKKKNPSTTREYYYDLRDLRQGVFYMAEQQDLTCTFRSERDAIRYGYWEKNIWCLSESKKDMSSEKRYFEDEFNSCLMHCKNTTRAAIRSISLPKTQTVEKLWIIEMKFFLCLYSLARFTYRYLELLLLIKHVHLLGSLKVKIYHMASFLFLKHIFLLVSLT